MSKRKPRVVDLFCGAGGFSIGLSMAGFEPIIGIDIDRDACETFRVNHPGVTVFEGNIADVPAESLRSQLKLKPGELELLVGGPPCQGFSTVGNKNPKDPRNRLFEHYFRLVESLRPKLVIFENVAGFRRLYGGVAFDAVCSRFAQLGYIVKPALLNAMDYGVPQSRVRTIVVGVSRGYDFEFPSPTHGDADGDPRRTEKLKRPLQMSDALGDLPMVAHGEHATSYKGSPQNDFQKLMRKRQKALTEHRSPAHGKHLLEVMSHVPAGGSILDVPLRLRPRSYFNNTYARLWWDRPSMTITRNFGTPSSSRCIHPRVDRGLTTREGARLQSFPDSYRLIGSRASKNLQIGNAVPPLLAKALGLAIRRSLGRDRKSQTVQA